MKGQTSYGSFFLLEVVSHQEWKTDVTSWESMSWSSQSPQSHRTWGLEGALQTMNSVSFDYV